MSGLALTFIVIPCIAACTAAWFIKDWRLAGATSAGSLGVLFIPGLTMMVPALAYVLPVLAGTAVGSTVSGVATYRSQDTTPWSRMLYALVITFSLAIAALLLLS
jgi:hypothetical protein